MFSDFSKVKQTQKVETDSDSDDQALLESCFESRTGALEALHSTASVDKYHHKSSTQSSSASSKPPPSQKSREMPDKKLSRKDTHLVEEGASQRKQCCKCSVDKPIASFPVPVPPPYNWWSMPCFPPYYQAPVHVKASTAHYQFPLPEPHAKVYKSTPPKLWNAGIFADVPKYETWEPAGRGRNNEEVNNESHVAVDTEISFKKQGT